MAEARPGEGWLRRFILVCGLVILTCALISAAAYALQAALMVPLYHLDGAYQTASGLYRLASGEVPGRDFLPYLGLGPLYILYPIFRAAGATVGAATWASHFTVAIGAGLQAALLFYLGFKPSSRSAALYAGGVAVLAAILFVSYVPTELVVFTPGNSLRPLRSTVPFLAATLILLAWLPSSGPAKRYALLGTIAGAAVLWSNDYGLPSFLLLCLLTLFLSIRTREATLRNAAIFVASSAVICAGLLLLATGGHPLPLLRYNFVDVAGDQWWYFGTWMESARVFTVGDLWRVLDNRVRLCLAGWLIYLVYAALRGDLRDYLLVVVGSSLFLGGLIPTVGGYNGWYFEQFITWSIASALFLGAGWISRRIGQRFAPNLTARLPALAIGLLALSGCFVAFQTGVSFFERRGSVSGSPQYFFVPELGGYMSADWSEYVAAARTSPLVTVEEYWGIWSALRGRPPLLPVDAVIHALGSVRSDASRVMDGAQVEQAITTRRLLQTAGWQAWSFSANWWYFRPVLQDFVPVATSPTTLIWRRDVHRVWPEAPCKISAERTAFTVDATLPGLYDIHIEYDVAPGGRRLIMVRNALNFAAAAQGYLSIDPRATEADFPVGIDAAGTTEFPVQVYGPKEVQGSATIRSCRARRVLVEHMNPSYLNEVVSLSLFNGSGVLGSFPLTDQNWVNGIARRWAGFFVEATGPNQARFVAGAVVTFANGENRTIQRTELNGPYLNVFVDGAPLDGDLVGWPQELKMAP